MSRYDHYAALQGDSTSSEVINFVLPICSIFEAKAVGLSNVAQEGET